MYKILKKQKLARDTYLMQIDAPLVAKHSKPGNFIVLRIDEKSQRIPLAISDYDKKTITIVFKAIGKKTKELSNLKKGSYILDFVGPLGNPVKTQESQNICLVGGGVDVASLYLVSKKYKENRKTKTTIIAGFKNKNHFFWEKKLKDVCDELIICTEDGSKGYKGLATDLLKTVLYKKKPDLVFAVGSAMMMYDICKITNQWVKTHVVLNPMIVDGLGMCGGCRVTVNETTKFTCIDGPEFNGHELDWDEIINRNNAYLEEHVCKLNKK